MYIYALIYIVNAHKYNFIANLLHELRISIRI